MVNEQLEAKGDDVTDKGRRFLNSLNQFCGFDRKYIVLVDDSTDERYGWLPQGRPINKYIEYGVINLDKPPGPTSHEVVAWIKRMLDLKRAGHGGTLEPHHLCGGAGIPQSYWSTPSGAGEGNKSSGVRDAHVKGVYMRDAAA